MDGTSLPVKQAPCGQCPFRKTSVPGWLGGGEDGLAADYLRLAHSDMNVVCHCSPGYDNQGEEGKRPCAGLALYRNNVVKTPRGGVSRDSVIAVAGSRHRTEVFANPLEFLAHHDTPANRKLYTTSE